MNLPESEQFELITTHPSFIIGPPIVPGHSVGEKIVTKFMTGKFSSVPPVMMQYVDVRDAAAS